MAPIVITARAGASTIALQHSKALLRIKQHTALQPRPAVCPTYNLRQRSAACVVRAADNGAAADVVEAGGLSLSQISFGSILLPIGISLMVYGFGAFFTLLPGGDISSLLLIYGFPLLILGFALKYAELPPVPCKSTRGALALRDSQMTDIQKQVRDDCTRYRYGDEQHLDEALTRIFKFGRAGGIPRRLSPKLIGLREEVCDGMYTLVMEFDSKLTKEQWDERQEKLQSFFGPGIEARITMVGERGADVALVCDGSGAGRGGKERPDVLPPLMPGLKARQQN